MCGGVRAARGAGRGGGGGVNVSGKVGRQEPEAGLPDQLSHFPAYLLTAAGLMTQSQAHDVARLQATGGAPGQRSSGRSVLAGWLVPWCCVFVGPAATLGMQALRHWILCTTPALLPGTFTEKKTCNWHRTSVKQILTQCRVGGTRMPEMPWRDWPFQMVEDAEPGAMKSDKM